MSNAHTLNGRSVLIVEVEPLVALDVRDAFSAAGAHVMSARTCSQALRLLDSPGLSAAVVDINLGYGEDCSEICERLAKRQIPFVFFTGEVRPDFLLRWPDAPVLTKLVDRSRIVQVIAGMTVPVA